jgi:hypothetical protein
VGIHQLDSPKLQRRVLTLTRTSDEKRPIVQAVLDEIQLVASGKPLTTMSR